MSAKYLLQRKNCLWLEPQLQTVAYMGTYCQLRDNISDIENLDRKTSGYYAHLSCRGGGRIILEPAVESNVVVPDKEKRTTV